MKSILALFVSVTIATAAVAQTNGQHDEAKHSVLGEKKEAYRTASNESRTVVPGSNTGSYSHHAIHTRKHGGKKAGHHKHHSKMKHSKKTGKKNYNKSNNYPNKGRK